MTVIKTVMGATLVLAAGTMAAQAGGIDRSGQSIGTIFEKTGQTGNFFQLSYGSITPSTNTSTGGNPLLDYSLLGLTYKRQFDENFSLTVIYDEPYGAAVQYPAGAPFLGSFATVESQAVTMVGRYETGSGFSVHGGLRAQKLSGSIQTSQRLVAESGYDLGYVVGAAYEIPDIALRVAVTYNSEIDNELTGTETVLIPPVSSAATSFTVTTPESVNLDFQSGIAKDTLLFGSIRHVRWAGFNLTTPTLAYASFTDNTTTYTLGIGRKFNDNWSGAVSIGYEAEGTKPTTTALAPYTGSKSITVGATYTQDTLKITGGVTYAKLGDTFLGGPISWSDGKAVGVGLRIGYSF
ncbi:hypothetical protein GU927_000340 [Rhodobacteraceae bacterium HSP-20]|uniref:Long-chain fatty acid transporter n=1 Tax=Paragemmobacter amnigenus TaxID=2852097 RepID=A0ABS6J058_9RHOB|nr:hypothetical protein [Rhodobacter amnigenus]MBU9696284.1 hypothetical protein [Rhodobacter amnigenus]MBV4387511.1 hypothetical protein [Rhodobacter amnigenus]